MAKVLFVVPIGQDMGGIITSTEQYVAGIREAGHEVTPLCAVFTKNDAPVGPAPRGKFGDDYRPGPGTGWLMHPTAGWRSEDRVSLMSAAGLARFAKLAKAADVVIWASMYGFRNDSTEGSTAWVAAIKAGRGKNVFMIHDDHLPERYPWALALGKYAAAWVGVQPCSYDSLSAATAPRAMVYTPLPAPPAKVPPMSQRTGYLNCQIWKTWKRADALVRAAPLLPKHSVRFAGDGIQLRYMRSPDKCPPRYAGIWEAAMRKQDYLGVLNENARDGWLKQSKFLVDLSLRHNSGQLNRIVQEAMAQGCVVIANPQFITGTDPNPLFKPGIHYLPITSDCYEPKDLVAVLRGYDRVDEVNYRRIQKAARDQIHLFSRASLGQHLVDIGQGGPGGLRYERDCYPVTLAQKRMFKEVFGDLP